MMHTPLCSPTDQGTCAGLSRWGTAPSCVSGRVRTAPEPATTLHRGPAGPEKRLHTVTHASRSAMYSAHAKETRQMPQAIIVLSSAGTTAPPLSSRPLSATRPESSTASELRPEAPLTRGLSLVRSMLLRVPI
jgi:hypothetical protein